VKERLVPVVFDSRSFCLWKLGNPVDTAERLDAGEGEAPSNMINQKIIPPVGQRDSAPGWVHPFELLISVRDLG